MSILVKGLDMPKKGRCIDIVILDDGTVIYYDDCYKKIGGAVELPDHGDLIDRDKLLKKVQKWYWEALETVKNMPVVIPAERKER